MKTIGCTGDAPCPALAKQLARLGWRLERAAPDTARLWFVSDPEAERDALTRARPDAEVLPLPTSAAVVALRRDPLTGLASRQQMQEILIALARPRPSDVRDEVEQLRARVAALGLPGTPDLRAGASAGLAWWQPQATLEAVLARADAALYAAKAKGRDRLCIDDAGAAADDGYGHELQRFLDLTQVYTDRLTQMVQLRSRRLVERARHDALQDRLTGAHNRRHFDQRLAREGAQSLRHGLPLSMIFLDLDDIGEVNRRHGYEAGDAALRHVVDALQPLVRLTDWLARWGGEEFCLVLPGTALDEAAGIADRMHAAVSATACGLPDGGTLHLTCSVGVATGVGADGLTERASAAARRAQAAGKNRVVVDRG